MKNSPRNLLFGYVRIVIIGTLAVVVLAIVGLTVHWQPAKTVKRQQSALIDAIESRKGARFRRLLSNGYNDRWKFNVTDVTEAMLDARSQFITMVITPDQETFELNGKRATLSARLTLGGTPMGAGNEVIRQVNQLKDPFIFTWEKQSFLPSSWRLISIENKSIPDNVWNYEPGSIRAAMQGRELP